MCVRACVKRKDLPFSHGRSIDPCHVAEMLERSYDWRTRYVSPYLFDSWAGRSPSALATNPHERWHVKKTTILSCQHWELGRLPLAGDAGHFKMRMDNLDITARRDIPPWCPRYRRYMDQEHEALPHWAAPGTDRTVRTSSRYFCRL